MKKTIKRILLTVLVLILSMSILTATVAAAPAAEQNSSAQSAGIGSFFKKIAAAVKNIIDKIFNRNPDPQPQPEDTTIPSVPDAPEADNNFEFKENVGGADYVGGFH